MLLNFKAIQQPNIGLAEHEPGSVIYTNEGNHYIVGSNDNLIKITDIIFANEKPVEPKENKLYVVGNQLFTTIDGVLENIGGSEVIERESNSIFTYDGENISKIEEKSIDGKEVFNTTLFTYDSEGNITTQTSNGFITTFKYDADGNITSMRKEEI